MQKDITLKKLPIGIQTFSKIRDKKENYLYVDKTDIAYELINNYSYVFLSRPRRFGKSLFLDTLHNIFEGHKENFEGLAIYDKWNFEVTYPVIKIAFGKVKSADDLKLALKKTLDYNQIRLEIDCSKDYDYATCFSDLIQKVYKKYNQKVVILIDEYDKPILDNLDNMEVALENRDILSRLYTEIKNAYEFVKFAMLTGVSKFAKASIFSGLNNLTDISLDERYGNICGYTQNDIETSFMPYLQNQDLDKIKEWYNGYNFLKDSMYNPFDILLFIDKGFKFKNYWFETGTPSFLLQLIKQNNYFVPNLSNIMVGEELVSSFDIENLDLEVVLFQAGYLTIDEIIQTPRGARIYKLKLPNREVKSSLSDVIIDFILKQNPKKLAVQDNIYDALFYAKLENLNESLSSMFASIPYNNYTKNSIASYEGYYATIIYIYFQSLGIEIVGEDVTNHGRIDLTLKINNHIFIIEFKVGDADALEQIKKKNYQQKYENLNQDIYLVGINFDEDERNISRFEWERV